MKLNDKERITLQVIDTWLNHRFQYSNLPGFQVCIRKKGHIIFSKAYGYANLKTKRPLKTNDLFHIASHSKTFTSCAILQLVEQGRLNLQHSAVEYLPELKKHRDKRFKNLTIRDFLSNRSGLFRDGVAADFWELQKTFPSKEQLIEEVSSSDLIYTPNICSKYSNIGFSLLGLILENIFGMPYQNAMEVLVFKKLKTTKIHPDYSEKLKNYFADGHSRPLLENKRLPLKHAAALAMAPATGFVGNAEETSLFFDKLLLGQGLLKKDMQRELLSLNWPIKNSSEERYGLGLEFEQCSDMELAGHSGGYPGFVTHTLHWLGTDYVISFFLNTNEILTSKAIRSIIQIIKRIDLTFSNSECKKAMICGPFMNKWQSLLFVLNKEKALGFSIESWSPSEEALLLKSKNGEDFLYDKQSGYDSVGEKIIFNKDRGGNIVSAKWGSCTFHQEKVFLERFKNTLL